MRITNYTKEQVEAALENSKSIKEFMANIGIPVNNGNYRRAKMIVEQYNLELPKFDFAENARIQGLRIRISNDDFFAKGNKIVNGQVLKKRLIEEGRSDSCSECGQPPTWNNKPLVLQLDHINGDRFDNRRKNLRILCPNCHTQTETYSNRAGTKKYTYCSCGARKAKSSIRCNQCNSKHRIVSGKGLTIIWPDVNEIILLIRKTNYSQVARDLGVSDNAIRNYLKNRGIDPRSLQPMT